MEDLKQALQRLAKAVVVITTADQNGRYAMSATAVSELSMEPPSMLICVNKSASLFPVLASGAPFIINILHHQQADISVACAGKVKGEARFEFGTWIKTTSGIHRLEGAQASIVCRNVKAVEFGTHGIFIGKVEEVFTESTPDPLIYVDRRYGKMDNVTFA
ncbi:NADH-FMN oxidoreductase RutF, flavin reductase (DIM6/NTAB) family [Pseudomonas cedrina]|uniref:Flavin reductase domain-containing protein n=2 Tax=Pseudomonas cedrina TaxID=651740 RepID=A0A1V2K1S4_PSECE|nr:flavin reductase family protein [Pseudomonas cedrina]ONH51653.1 flavin reductase domain-containing protein [Pseudomonas cedrina subsp. cedrina]SDT09002.1 NADH-FMN oxidoreductase RutF, flavin reductase (DIM6/NTAB) family [Pseudomonas cedrina]